MQTLNTVYLLIGGNLGDRKLNLETALLYIEQKMGFIISRSSVYKTAPWGLVNQNDFLNQALLIHTTKNCTQLLEEILAIELLMGRKRDNIKWAERTMDIDILFFNTAIINEQNLQVPHPHLHKRNFVLTPLLEIANTFVHPKLNKTIQQLMAECEDLTRNLG